MAYLQIGSDLLGFHHMALVNRLERRGEMWGMLAFAGTGVFSFSSFGVATRVDGEMWQLGLTFALGFAFIFLGVISSHLIDGKPASYSVVYCIVQTIIGVAAIYISPLRGFIGIMLLPLASQMIFIFRWPVALTWGLGLYFFTAGVYLVPYGWDSFRNALLSYSPAYLFTIIFTYATRDALLAREKAVELSEELESANAQLRLHAEQAEELATIRERNRLAREIHDGVGHYLTVINVQLEAARALLQPDPEKASTALDKASRLSRDALEDVRRSVGSLRAEENRPPFMESLQALIADSPLPVEFKTSGDTRELSSATEHALFRAAQEGLTNVSKHAAADHIWIELQFDQDQHTRLIIADDGQGAKDGADGGFGLRGMQERIELLGGRVQLGTREGGGFSLTVEVPS